MKKYLDCGCWRDGNGNGPTCRRCEAPDPMECPDCGGQLEPVSFWEAVKWIWKSMKEGWG